MTRLRPLLLFSVAALVAGCSDDLGGTDPGTIMLADLAGTYQAQSFVYDENGGANRMVDLVAGGGSLSFTQTTDGGFDGDLFAPFLDSPNVPFEGRFILQTQSRARIDFAAPSQTVFTDLDIDFTFAPSNFVWSAPDVMFDFTGSNDPALETSADLTIVLVRTSP
jgi:hypothetical protein